MLQAFTSKLQPTPSLIPQPNDYTCQSACLGMAMDNPDIMAIRDRLEALGEPGDPAVMALLMREHFGDRYSYNSDASLNDAKEQLKQGAFLIVHSYLSRSGHVIALNGIEIDTETQSYRFKVLDPWSEFNFKAWAYDGSSVGYSGYYSSYGIYAACVAGQSASDAADIYRRGELSSDSKGMWLHIIRP